MSIFLKIIIVLAILGIGLATVILCLGVIFLLVCLLRRLSIIPECYKVIDYNRENICLRSGKKKLVIKWREVDSFCSYSLSSSSKRRISGPIKLELRNGETYTLGWLSGDIAALLGRLYDIFLESLKFDIYDVEQVKFSHPISWIRFKNKNLRQLRLFCVLLGLLWLALWIGIIIHAAGEVLRMPNTYFFALFIPVLCIIVLLRARLFEREHKGLVCLQANGDSLTFQDESGKSQTQHISEIIDWHLDKTKGVLTFSNGTKLNDLEKLRHWPILREHLLSKLQLREKT